MNTKSDNLSLKTKKYIMSVFVKISLYLLMFSIVKTKSDERPLNRIAINGRKTFPYKNNNCIWMSRKIAFQNCLRMICLVL
jgi:hypothetical protein